MKISRKERYSCMKNNHGFTLLEVIVTLSIFSMMISLVYGITLDVVKIAPSFQKRLEFMNIFQTLSSLYESEFEKADGLTIIDEEEFVKNYADYADLNGFELDWKNLWGGDSDPDDNPVTPPPPFAILNNSTTISVRFGRITDTSLYMEVSISNNSGETFKKRKVIRCTNMRFAANDSIRFITNIDAIVSPGGLVISEDNEVIISSENPRVFVQERVDE